MEKFDGQNYLSNSALSKECQSYSPSINDDGDSDKKNVFIGQKT